MKRQDQFARSIPYPLLMALVIASLLLGVGWIVMHAGGQRWASAVVALLAASATVAVLSMRRTTLRVNPYAWQTSSGVGSMALAQIDAAGVVVEANESFLEMTGYSHGELRAGFIEWRRLLASDEARAEARSLQVLRENGGSGESRRELVLRDGRRLPVIVRLIDFPGGDGGCTVLLQRVEELTLLREETHRLGRIVEHSQQPILLLALDGEVKGWNSGAANVYGYEATEVVGQSMRRMMASDSDEPWRQLLAMLASGEGGQMETTLRSKEGAVMDLTLRLLPDHSFSGALTGGVCLLRDRSDKQRAKILEAQFQQAQKLESLGRLAGGVAHDFNNLLMVITSFVQLLGEDESIKSEQKQFLDEIQTAADRAAALTRQLLAFSRKQAQKLEALDFNNVIAETGRMLERMIGEDVKVRVQPGERLWKVEADNSQLTQVLMNLCVNARDAMPRGGELAISTANVASSVELPIAGLPPGEWVCLTVRDTGCGMSEEARTHLFEPFFTTKEQGRGTGLGLSMVYGVVKQCNGLIQVDSAPGEGTSFRIYLPRTQKAVRKNEVEESAVSISGVETLLVVEDEHSLRSSIAQYLERRGYRVVVASNGAEALHLVRTRRARIDLMLTDMVMPEMNGRELWLQMKREFGVFPVIFMTGYADARRVGEDEAGSIGFLNKPFSLEELARAVRRLIDTVKEPYGVLKPIESKLGQLPPLRPSAPGETPTIQ